MARKLTGIERAVQIARTQTALAAMVGVGQGRVQDWLGKGYVPAARAPLVAKVTNIPLADLLRKTPRKNRNGKRAN